MPLASGFPLPFSATLRRAMCECIGVVVMKPWTTAAACADHGGIHTVFPSERHARRTSAEQPTRPQAQLFVERRDRDEVLERVRRNGYALEFAAAELLADNVIVFEAVKQDGSALQFAPGELRVVREILLEAVKQDGYALRFAAAELRADREIVLESVKQDGSALEFAVAELRAVREIVGGSEGTLA